ncbi:hypothetical protein [Streptomyces sp. cf386]|uniref:hypothetical protein n=1 Tax=Streptomyces sp. cf386 TaxID=1761904 RepID=UPI000B80C844|nr:hypothetical protein [Streptomyces sp. cf386]
MEDDKRRQEREAEATRRTAFAPTSCATRGCAPSPAPDSLSGEDEHAAVNRLPGSDPAAALAVNTLLACAREAGVDSRSGPAL